MGDWRDFAVVSYPIIMALVTHSLEPFREFVWVHARQLREIHLGLNESSVSHHGCLRSWRWPNSPSRTGAWSSAALGFQWACAPLHPEIVHKGGLRVIHTTHQGWLRYVQWSTVNSGRLWEGSTYFSHNHFLFQDFHGVVSPGGLLLDQDDLPERAFPEELEVFKVVHSLGGERGCRWMGSALAALWIHITDLENCPATPKHFRHRSS